MAYTTTFNGPGANPEATFKRLIAAYTVLQSEEVIAPARWPRTVELSVPVAGKKPGKTKIVGYDGLPHRWRHLLAAIVRHFGPATCTAIGQAKFSTAVYVVTIQPEVYSGHELLAAQGVIAAELAAAGLPQAEIDRLSKPDEGKPRLGRPFH